MRVIVFVYSFCLCHFLLSLVTHSIDLNSAERNAKGNHCKFIEYNALVFVAADSKPLQMFFLIVKTQSLAQQSNFPKYWWPADSCGIKESKSCGDDCKKIVDCCKLMKICALMESGQDVGVKYVRQRGTAFLNLSLKPSV